MPHTPAISELPTRSEMLADLRFQDADDHADDEPDWCETCHGTGLGKRENMRCAACHGAGEVRRAA